MALTELQKAAGAAEMANWTTQELELFLEETRVTDLKEYRIIAQSVLSARHLRPNTPVHIKPLSSF